MHIVLRELVGSWLGGRLSESLDASSSSVAEIERCFRLLTSRRHHRSHVRTFFGSWGMTNNSAMCVSGLSNRMTLRFHRDEPIREPQRLVDAITALNRITDEDLGVGGGVLHRDLFYRMATSAVGDDEWLTHRHITPAGREFKDWKDRSSLKDPDLMVGLLTTVVHEIYTHGEVEFIYPLFYSWLTDVLGVPHAEARKDLGWIAVHCGPTERLHFMQAVKSLFAYCDATGTELETYDVRSIFDDYFVRKARVMSSVLAVMQETPQVSSASSVGGS